MNLILNLNHIIIYLVNKKLDTDKCTKSIECDDNKGLICINEICSCSDDKYFDKDKNICSNYI